MNTHRPIRNLVGTAALLLAVTAGSPARAEPITTQRLLGELSDLGRLAEFPSPTYTTKQFSSYDPASKSASDPKTWFANADWDHWHGTVQRGDRTEYIMMQADGPGAVVRIWSANPAGTLRVYIDGSETPAIDAPMERLLSGKVAGFPEPIAGVQGKGYNLYLPIPYAKSCLVTTDHKGFYYAVDYRTYPAGTDVTSFTRDEVRQSAEAIAQQAKRLSSPRSAGVPADHSDAFDTTIAAGETKSLGKLDGERAISELLFRVAESTSEAQLRAAVLRLTFDGETTVEVPLGDFFGSGPGVNAYEGLPLGMSASREIYSHWLMPFRQSANVEIHNLGSEPIAVAGQIGSVARPWTDRSMHFNAGYRAAYDRQSQPPFDWNYLNATGKGVFVGASFTIDNPVKAWWGEGDEKFYVDGETSPSWFGTGTEDYFSYAWSWTERFQHAYHSQPRIDGPGNYGRSSVNRFHIIDDVPFNTSFKFDMEMWHWKQCVINMAVTTYWYAMPGGKDDYAPLTPADLVVRPLPPYQPMKVAGAIEGETMTVLHHTGDASPQDWADLSGDQHLWWRDNREGDVLVLGFDVPKEGRYRVRGRFLSAVDYGIAKLAINDQPVQKTLDLYHDGVTLTDEIDLGTFDLKQGQNPLTVTAVGTNPAGQRKHLFGLDYLRLEPADAR